MGLVTTYNPLPISFTQGCSTMATLTASGSRKVQAGHEPLVPEFVRAPYNQIEAIHTIAENRNDIVAITLETIQNEWLLIVDEVQTGIGRARKLFSFQGLGIQPNVVTLAKA